MTSKSIIALFAIMTALGFMPTAARGQILVPQGSNGTIGEYTTDGATLNASLIPSLQTTGFIAVSGGNLFVVNGPHTIGEYTTDGTMVNASLISGIITPANIAVSGGNLFVVDAGNVGLGTRNGGKVGKYTTSGATVNASLITGLDGPLGIAVSGSSLFVTNLLADTIGEYTTDGAPVNASLITGSGAWGIAASGDHLFVASPSGRIGEYTTDGATVNASLISGLNYFPYSVAVSGTNLFVVNTGTYTGAFSTDGFAPGTGTVGEYTTDGATVNASLITGLNYPKDIVVLPEPSTWALLAMGAGALFAFRRCR